MMGRRATLLLLAVVVGVAAAAAASASRGFLLTGPKRLLAGHVETFCISVEKDDQPLCSLDLISADDDTLVYASVQHQLEGRTGCMKLAVPKLRAYDGRLRLRMQGAGSADAVQVLKEVRFSTLDPIHLIETDKAWYTPGQLVRFRLLSLDRTLHPITHTIHRVYVEDPTGIAVAQWTNLTSDHGLHQLQVQLSSEPVQGVWRIVREDEGSQRFHQEFEVREFVLPKFEVVIKPPPSITYNDKSDSSVKKISLDVCAKYSYGQPVRGNWTAVIEVTDEDAPWFSRPPVKPITLLRNGVLDVATGCYSLKLPSDQLGVLKYDGSYDKTVKVTATVVEKGTAIEMNSTWSTVVKQHRGVTLESVSSVNFKTFLPYDGLFKVADDNGAGKEGVAVELCLDATYQHKDAVHPSRRPVKTVSSGCSVHFSDELGFVRYQLLATDPELTEFNVKATVSPNDDDVVERQLRIRKTFSRSQSFLSVTTPFQSPGNPAVPCATPVLPVGIYFTAEEDVDVLDMDIHYVVVSRGDVILSGTKKVEFRPESDRVDFRSASASAFLNVAGRSAKSKAVGSVTVDIPLQQMKGRAGAQMSILAYVVRDDAEVVTGHAQVTLENCFPNPVKMWWGSHRRQPGDRVTLNVEGGAGSLCGLAVVDRSVSFMRPDLQLSESKIFQRLDDFHIGPFSQPSQVTDDWQYCYQKSKVAAAKAEAADAAPEVQDEDDDEEVLHESYFMPSYFISSSTDAMEAFDQAGLVVISDLDIETRPCDQGGRNRFMLTARSGGLVYDAIGEDEDFDSPMPMAATDLQEVDYETMAPKDLTSSVAVRSYFPETWLWDLVTLDSSGRWKDGQLELPHSVTTWQGRAICVSEAYGFGMASGAGIEAFQSFFLQVHVPYAAKRTEKLQVKVSVFNYIGDDLPVRLSLVDPSGYRLVGEPSVQLCVPARDNVVHRFTIDVDQLGTHNVTVSAVVDGEYPGLCGPEFIPAAKDTVVKELLVEPEGFPMERVYSLMTCPKDFEDDTMLTWDLSLPDDVVEGSARAWITAVGDLMGPALQGLSGLVRMPMGCGEQNMVLFTPNIYVMHYLQSTQQLDDSIEDQALGYMKQGYQRQLNYRHSDGSYSAFGKSDPSGSLWLTAFVVKSFAAARRYIDIDDGQLKLSVRWLLGKQLENGCFPMVGTVLHKDLKGGLADVDEDLSALTAYTLIALLESSAYDSADASGAVRVNVEETLSCLQPEDEEPDARDVYTTALTAYALALAGRTQECRANVDWLLSNARNDGPLTWWEKPGSGAALSVEVSSYVVLTLVKLGGSQDLLRAASVVRWLSKQRNSQGGFVSTQDTVVALQAIGVYASVIGAQEIDMKLTVLAGDSVDHIVINESNRLVQQRVDLPPTSTASQVSVVGVARGDGCAVLQTTLRYNVATAPAGAAFEVKVAPEALIAEVPCSGHKVAVCVRYTLASPASQASSNMALLEVAMVSGYQANKESLHLLKVNGLVKRFEVKEDDVVVLYFEQIDARAPTCVEFDVDAIFVVEDVKESTVKVYDYYQPEHVTSTSYILPTACVDMDLPVPPPPRRLPLPPLDDYLDLGNEFEPPLALPSVKIEPIVEDIPSGASGASGASGTSGFFLFADAPAPPASAMDRFGDLDFPDGIEGPVGVATLPGASRGCPRCLRSMDGEALLTAYCAASTVFTAELRGSRLRLLSDLSVSNNRTPMNSTAVELYVEPHCQCSSLHFKRKKMVSVLGLAALPHPAPPLQLVVGADVVIIEQNAKQLKLKSLRKKCNAVARPPFP